MPAQQPEGKKKKFVPPTPEELTPLFPSYEITDFVAAGGMGAVYKAKQKSLDRSVAIKILPKEFGDDRQFRESFEAEAKAMAKLNHPNLMAVYDFGNIEGMLFIVMEFVKGKALYYSAHRKQIDPETAFKMILRISKGLAHAHDNGILHRDIKPANILLLPDTTPKIGDFGLARPVDSRGHRERVTFGTPGYTAPEVYSKKYPVDQRSDIFSLGAMLCELLTGELPKPNSSYMVTGIDPRYDAITRKATHPVPAQRHKDTHEFIKEIKELIPNLSKKGPRLATGLSSTGQITTRVTSRTTSHVTSPVVTSAHTQPIITSPITGHLTSRVTGHVTQRQGLATTKRSGSPLTTIMTIVGLLAVAAVVFIVVKGQRIGDPIIISPADGDPASPDQSPPPENQPSDQGLSSAGKATIVPENNNPSSSRPSDKILTQTITNIRKKIQDHHARVYRRYSSYNNRIPQTFSEYSIKYLNTQATTLSTDKRNRLIKLIEKHRDKNELPKTLPSIAPEALHSKLRTETASWNKNKKNQQQSFEKALSEYLNSLNKAAQKYKKDNLPQVVGGLEIERTYASRNRNRVRLILLGKNVPLPPISSR